MYWGIFALAVVSNRKTSMSVGGSGGEREIDCFYGADKEELFGAKNLVIRDLSGGKREMHTSGPALLSRR